MLTNKLRITYRVNMTLPYPPPYMSKAVLCQHISVSDRTVDNWVKLGILPAPKLRGGLLLWKWAEVDRYLDNGGPNMPEEAGATTEERIRVNTERATHRR